MRNASWLATGLLTLIAPMFCYGGKAVATQDAVLCGRVLDESGAVLPGVTLQVSAEGAKREFHSVWDGSYRFEDLSPGTYVLTAELSGFRSLRLIGVTLRANRVHTLDLVLPIARGPSTTEELASSLLSRPRLPVESRWQGDDVLKNFIHLANGDARRTGLVQLRSESGASFLRLYWGRGVVSGLVIGRPASLFPVCGVPELAGPHPLNLDRLGPKYPTRVEFRLRHSLSGLDAFALQWVAGPWSGQHADSDVTKGTLVSDGTWSSWRFALSRPHGPRPSDLVGFCLMPIPSGSDDEEAVDEFLRLNASAYIDLAEIRVIGE